MQHLLPVTFAVALPWRDHLFLSGLRAGLITLAVGVGIGFALRLARRDWTPPLAGLLAAGAALAALEATDQGAPGLVRAVAILGSVGLLLDAARPPALVQLVLLGAGGWILATQTGVPPFAWVQWLVGVTAVVGGVLAADLDRRWAAEGLAGPLLAVSAVGLYFTVPDTEHARILAGAVLPIALLCWPFALLRLGTGGAAAALGLFAWTAAIDGVGRPATAIAGVLCIGLLAIEPLSRWLSRRSVSPLEALRRLPMLLNAPAASAVHLGVVLVASRAISRLWQHTPRTAIAGGILVGGTTAIGALVARRSAEADYVDQPKSMSSNSDSR